MIKLIYLRWLIVLGLLVYLVWQNVWATAPLYADSNLLERQSGLGVLLPAGRVVKTNQGLQVKQEPLYLDVKIPPRANLVNLKITVTGSAELMIGSHKGQDWSYDFWPTKIDYQAEEKIYSITAYLVGPVAGDYNWRFILSVKGLADNDLFIKKAQVEILRQPFTWSWLSHKISDWL